MANQWATGSRNVPQRQKGDGKVSYRLSLAEGERAREEMRQRTGFANGVRTEWYHAWGDTYKQGAPSQRYKGQFVVRNRWHGLLSARAL